MPKDNYSEIDHELTVDRYRRDNAELRGIIDEQGKQIAELIKQNRRSERGAKLTALRSQGYVFNLAKEVERCAAMSDEDYAAHVEDIKENYRRDVTDDDAIETADVGGKSQRRPASDEMQPDFAANGDAAYEQMRKQNLQLLRYAERNGHANSKHDGLEAVEGFLAGLKSKSAS